MKIKTENLSKEYKNYIRKQNLLKYYIISMRIFVLIAFFALWELLTYLQIVDSFFISSPSRIVKTLITLLKDHSIITHSLVTLNEAIISFTLATLIGLSVSIILWWFENLSKIVEPYLVIINALPKVALGPLILIWFGVGTQTIVAMSIFIMIIITIMSINNAFNSSDQKIILLLKSMGASKLQILLKLIIPNAIPQFISILKINVGLSWVGVIMGEYIVSHQGLGYLIQYSGAKLEIDVVMTAIFVLCILSASMYFVVACIEKYMHKKRNLK